MCQRPILAGGWHLFRGLLAWGLLACGLLAWGLLLVIPKRVTPGKDVPPPAGMGRSITGVQAPAGVK